MSRRRLLVAIGCLVLVLSAIAIAPRLRPDPGPPAEPSRPTGAGWTAVADPATGLSYQVPPEWTVAASDESLETSNGVRLAQLADFGAFTCQGADYGRAFTGIGLVRSADPATAATDLAAAVAADQYSDGVQTARVALAAPHPLIRDGARGALVRADAMAGAARIADPCTGRAGTVTVIALAVPAGSAVFVIGADTVAGPQEPVPLLPAARLSAITASVRPGGPAA